MQLCLILVKLGLVYKPSISCFGRNSLLYYVLTIAFAINCLCVLSAGITRPNKKEVFRVSWSQKVRVVRLVYFKFFTLTCRKHGVTQVPNIHSDRLLMLCYAGLKHFQHRPICWQWFYDGAGTKVAAHTYFY